MKKDDLVLSLVIVQIVGLAKYNLSEPAFVLYRKRRPRSGLVSLTGSDLQD